MTTTFEMNSWEAHILLEACHELQKKWDEIARTTEDDDVNADYSNDLCQLEIVNERLTEVAVAAFGESLTNFSRESVFETAAEPQA